MTDKRKDDADTRRSWLRSGSRVFEVKGLWYFHTREGTVEGPFADRFSAENVLDSYVKVMRSNFAPPPVLTLEGDEHAPARSAHPLDLGLGRVVRS
ncbi:MAG: hypothetical protein CALGDGBN_01321 [Pseudomonadales bacterium]|nr:hypothetical protein [Pseudomonadales bacterium]